MLTAPGSEETGTRPRFKNLFYVNRHSTFCFESSVKLPRLFNLNLIFLKYGPKYSLPYSRYIAIQSSQDIGSYPARGEAGSDQTGEMGWGATKKLAK